MKLPIFVLLTITGGLVWAMMSIPGRIDIAHATTLALGVGAVCTLLGYSLGIFTMLFVNRQYSELETKRFAQNVSENIGIMSKMQGLMNAQNAQLLKQNTAMQKPTTTPPALPEPIFSYEDGIFSELQ
jgi:hypothetical protein